MPQPSALERSGEYIGDVLGAVGREASNTVLPELGDHFSAAMGAATGWGGKRGDYAGNLNRQRTESELAKINSPVASAVGEAAGNFLQGALGARGLMPTMQDAMTSFYLKDRTPPLPSRYRIQLRR